MVKYSSTSAASDASRPTAMSNALLKATNWYTLDGSSSPVQKTLSGFSDAMVSYWGTQATNAKTDLASQTVIQNNLKSSMSSVSSVSTDTELAKLIQLQSTYSANAHVMSTVRDMLNSLLQSV